MSASLSLLLLPALCSAPASAQDPFLPGLRWSAAPPAASPSIPRAAVFAAGGDLLWSVENGANPHQALRSSQAAAPSAPLARVEQALVSGSLGLAAARDGSALFALVQVPAPDALRRRTQVTGHDAHELARAAPARWTWSAPFSGNGAARLACDRAGDSVWVAAADDTAGEVLLERLAGLDGRPRASLRLPATSVGELVCSADGARAALFTGLQARVVDGGGALLHQQTLAAATTALALSPDGRSLALGGSTLRVLRDAGAGYLPQAALTGRAGELAVRCALSGDGATLAVGWWDALRGDALRFEVWDLPQALRRFEHVQGPSGGGLQNLPEAVRLSDDGALAVFGCWGDGTAAPEVVVWRRGSALAELELDLPGSVFALALDPRAERLAVGIKSAHANQFATRGEWRLFDLQARDLALLAPPLPGGSLRLAARSPGALACLLLEGQAASSPLSFPGVAGQLLLRRSALTLRRQACDAQGRADYDLPLGLGVAGSRRHFQALFRDAAGLGLGHGRLDALIL